MIIQQPKEFSIPSLQSIKCDIHQAEEQLLTIQFNNIKSGSDPLLQRTIDMMSAKCSSLWLTALPIQDQGFHLNKQEFQDALQLRYGWELSRVPSYCVCGASFSANHAMICHHGELTFIHHNELRVLTASWLHKVCHDVAVEPPSQPLNCEALVPTSANRRDDARADIHARSFWGRRQDAFLISGCFIQRTY